MPPGCCGRADAKEARRITGAIETRMMVNENDAKLVGTGLNRKTAIA
jgi:hypothetical protein